ncbi:hypothetical protein [Actinokineospora sp. NPDC004072]
MSSPGAVRMDVCAQCSATAHVWSAAVEQTIDAGGFSFVISSRRCVCTLCACSAVLSSAVSVRAGT